MLSEWLRRLSACIWSHHHREEQEAGSVRLLCTAAWPGGAPVVFRPPPATMMATLVKPVFYDDGDKLGTALHAALC